MKKIRTLALAAFCIGGTSAMAADMPVYKAAPLPVWTWAGVYFGAHAGGGWGRSQWTLELTPGFGNGTPLVNDQRPSGWVVGGQLGARWQWGAWVVGIEGTLAASAIRANDPFLPLPALPAPLIIPAGTTLSEDTRIQNIYSVTGQLGYAFNRTLWYVKGGWAGAQVNLQQCTIVGVAPDICASSVAISRQATGWTAGTGIEYLVLQTLSLGIEYDYFRLRTGNTNGEVLGATAPLVASTTHQFTDIRQDIHQVVARANYRLDWGILWGGPTPIAARY